jgi:hypothetical protein
MDEAGTLSIAYRLKGTIEALRIPPDACARRVAGLWQHTCFELFLSGEAGTAYYEFNFAPSREWAAYGFSGYRDGGPLQDEELDPRIIVRRAETILELHAQIRLHRLPALARRASLRAGVSAVIETSDGRLSYWALEHGPGKPDFHRPDTFILRI